MRVILVVLLVLIAVPVAGIFLSLGTKPQVDFLAPPTEADAKRVRSVARELRAKIESANDNRVLEMTAQDMDAIMRMAARFTDRVRARATLEPGVANIQGSFRITETLWSNAGVEILDSTDGVRLGQVRLGEVTFPGNFLVPVAGLALDMALGDGMGSIAMRTVTGVEINSDKLAAVIGIDVEDKDVLSDSIRRTAGSALGLPTPEAVRREWNAIDAAGRTGALSGTRAFPDYLRFALNHAATTGARPEAAILALAIHCGHRRFEQALGDVLDDAAKSRRSPCQTARLAGRGDLRQHFALSAGLQILSDAGTAFAVGEFKELLDNNDGGSGFSFDDIAADRAGIRLSERVTGLSGREVQRFASQIRNDSDILPPVRDLPSGLSEAEFKQRFGTVESKAYRDMLSKIDAMLDGLPLYHQ